MKKLTNKQEALLAHIQFYLLSEIQQLQRLSIDESSPEIEDTLAFLFFSTQSLPKLFKFRPLANGKITATT